MDMKHKINMYPFMSTIFTFFQIKFDSDINNEKNSLITSNFHYNCLISFKTHENENSPMLANLITQLKPYVELLRLI